LNWCIEESEVSHNNPTSSIRRLTLSEGGDQHLKATGIVRRIDDLGRVVIPKEIRRTLRIREGDPLEIFVDRDGEVILKKYSPIGELGEFAKEYAESVAEATGHISLIADRDVVIAVSGTSKKDFMEKPIGEDVEQAMEDRKVIVNASVGEYSVLRDRPERFTSRVIAPIISAGDPIGAVILLSRDDGTKMGDMEQKLAETAALFLGKQMEQ
jgi:AbrB family transcriptional regulator, stage V sporulation protein T